MANTEQSASLRENIRALLADLFVVDLATLDDEVSLLEAGILDSTGVLELVSEIEDRFDLEIDDTEITPDNLDSVARLTRFLAAKTTE